MKLEGSHTVHASRDKVWHLILDPNVLARCTPGVKSMEADGEDKYKAILELGIGPVRGQFAGNVQVTEKIILKPWRYLLMAQVAQEVWRL